MAKHTEEILCTCEQFHVAHHPNWHSSSAFELTRA